MRFEVSRGSRGYGIFLFCIFCSTIPTIPSLTRRCRILCSCECWKIYIADTAWFLQEYTTLEIYFVRVTANLDPSHIIDATIFSLNLMLYENIKSIEFFSDLPISSSSMPYFTTDFYEGETLSSEIT